MKKYLQMNVSKVFLMLSNILYKLSRSRRLTSRWEVSKNQFKSTRAAQLKSLIDNFDRPINVLEIGTWYGLGSTKVFKDNLPRGSSLFLLDRWEAYASDADLGGGRLWYEQMDTQAEDALNKVIELNPHFVNEGIKVSIIKSESSYFMSYLKEDFFDLIFIDGSHYYLDVKSDIERAKKIVKKDFGIICGDDLEEFPTTSTIEKAKAAIKFDSHVDGFHPGVLVAISEEFNSVNMKDGFWFVYCIDAKFTVSADI